jgi:membrane protease YdiL (CAAX protease family)
VTSLLGAVSTTLGFVRRHPLAAFFVTAFCFSWSDWLVLAWTGERITPGSMPTHFAGLLGPGFAAVAVTVMAEGRAGLKELLARAFRFPARSVWAWALPAMPLLFLLAGIATLAVSGKRLPTIEAFERFPGLPPMDLPGVFELVLIAAGLGQELGWRGYALPRLQARYGPLAGALLLAVPWGLWLLPQFLVNEAWAALGPAALLGLAVTLVSSSVVLAFVAASGGGNVPGAAFWHATFQMATATAAARGFLDAWVSGAVVFWALGLVVAEVQARQEGRTILAPWVETPAFRFTPSATAP